MAQQKISKWNKNYFELNDKQNNISKYVGISKSSV